MTLSLLWRSEGRLHLASDSRISFGSSGTTDIGIKVMSLPIRIRGTELDQHGQLEVLLDAVYRFCYAGSLVNATIFKSLIEDLLIDGQYVHSKAQLSFDEICGFLCRYSEAVSTEIVSRLAENGVYTFFIAGLCPQTKLLRGAQFRLAQDAGKTSATFEDVAQNEGEYVALGTGADEFNKLIAKLPVNRDGVLLTLNKVIDEGIIPSVGGDIQYGSFNRSGNFSTYGIMRISEEFMEINGKTIGPSEQRIMKYRGFDLYAGWTLEGSRFWVSPGLIELQVPSNQDSKERFIKK
jgi:hypothetical protein